MKDSVNKIWTIPNILSLVRLAMIPVIIWLYVGKESILWSSVVLFLSGVTDFVDGFVARRFHMVSDVGKVLDPIADKLTQLAVLACLCIHHPMMLLPCLLLVVKEVFNGIVALVAVNRTGKVYSAEWHGKLTTGALYVIMLMHFLWLDIPIPLSYTVIFLCSAIMVLSLVLYVSRNFRVIRGTPKEKK